MEPYNVQSNVCKHSAGDLYSIVLMPRWFIVPIRVLVSVLVPTRS